MAAKVYDHRIWALGPDIHGIPCGGVTRIGDGPDFRYEVKIDANMNMAQFVELINDLTDIAVDEGRKNG